jgi:outer membrane protein OmpA-like peptidoglycan-associated protein
MKNIILVLICALMLFGCASQGAKQNQGTAVGAGTGAVIGAVLGQAIGRDTEATLWGAAAGAAVGALAGNQIGAYMDRQEAAMQNAMAASIAANQASIRRANQDLLMATFKSDVFFGYDSSILKSGAYTELNRVANALNQYPQTNVQVQGHTDRSGGEEYNMALSQRRADAVVNYLIQRQVSPQRLIAIGLGESQPISSDPAQNRRVTLVLTPIQ